MHSCDQKSVFLSLSRVRGLMQNKDKDQSILNTKFDKTSNFSIYGELVIILHGLYQLHDKYKKDKHSKTNRPLRDRNQNMLPFHQNDPELKMTVNLR